MGSITRLNTDAERVKQQSANESAAQVREAWLSVDFLRMTTTVGKINLGYYFDKNRIASDETTQFLNTSLVNNPMLRRPENGAGAVVQLNLGGKVDLMAGIQNSDPAVNNTDKVYIIFEIDYHSMGSKEGNWRFWSRRTPSAGGKEKSAGMGISLDPFLHAQELKKWKERIKRQKRFQVGGSIGLHLIG